MEDLTKLMHHITLSDRRKELNQLLFSPNQNSGIREDILDNIPRYLFRVVFPGSCGTSNERWVQSGSASQQNRYLKEDIFSNLNYNKRKATAHMLNSHLRWWPDYGVDDNFVSWTSSLLFAIQYIYYQYWSNWDVWDLTDIHLYVIDTAQFPRGTFMRDMDLINVFCGVDDSLNDFKKMRTGPKYYFGEYLSQGALKVENKCQMISADILFEHDRLRRIQPQFGDTNIRMRGEHAEWANEVIRLRGAIWRPRVTPSYWEEEMRDRLEAIKEIINHVEDGWKLPIAIYLAAFIGSESSICPAYGYETAYDNIFFAYFRSPSFSVSRQNQEDFRPSNFLVAPHRMPELENVQRLVREIHNHSQFMIARGRVNEAECRMREEFANC